MAVKEIIRLFVATSLIALVLGHGRLISPASRNSAWRFFPNRPKQYTDNELNCGGFNVQWNKNNGKCGVCGDAYHNKNPYYVYPGKYAKDGFITKTYKEGQEIEVTIDITSNHQGYFRFSVGKLVNRPITQEQLKHVLLQPDGSNTWPLHASRNGVFKIKLLLPKGLTCDHCVMQWWWTVGNNWGCNDNGDCGEGLGKKQETFVNCADIKIESAGGPVPTGAPNTNAPSTESPTTQKPMTQSPSTQEPSTEEPSTTEARVCRATGVWAGDANMDKWCRMNCARGYCPASHCQGEMAVKEITRLFVAASLIALVLGHGRLFDPASRNSAWRFFPNRPKQYTDNELNCGGFNVQWSQNNGKCGVCGDAYHNKNPKYVYPGKYAKDGFITKTYKEGQEIEVTIDITSNHQGYFRFSVGKLVNRPITQEQLKHVLLQPDGSNTWPLHASRNGEFKIKLVLPKGLTCDHCVMQWWWTVGNNWGCNDNGDCGEGLGKKQRPS
ncbi:hypothetical protein OS493_012736 [Desmophyllum pertusum]|uniref:Chitin-binding type-4 domain-containing protein n=1 Tax=Desmophyllum pertusum TaxID=174260 RepID=A0A9W9ZH91_9CNID|nr:hypothetical protein OS493_012736 [Desmophyllum pertusum]